MLKKLGLTLAIAGMALVPNVSFANNQAKIDVVKKAVFNGKVSPYATQEFKSILQKAHQIDKKMSLLPDYEGMGCEFAEHYYLGHGNGGPEKQDFKNLKANVLQGGDVQVTYTLWGNKESLRFKLACNGSSCLINDVHSKDFGSLKQDAKKMIATNSCGY
ncbi:hypothetical protein [Moraxella sp. ZY210820]|uniref:hypothetical protein n=1 Tax=unclassified Moraxella TaxID=2685852 RepID=UPI0027321901|nr:hypothetical protein [Moraxella sp. ZY210820]WLF83953.1 hypothetical protein LU301_00095 [Moraxella sp. ZY210820]